MGCIVPKNTTKQNPSVQKLPNSTIDSKPQNQLPQIPASDINQINLQIQDPGTISMIVPKPKGLNASKSNINSEEKILKQQKKKLQKMLKQNLQKKPDGDLAPIPQSTEPSMMTKPNQSMFLSNIVDKLQSRVVYTNHSNTNNTNNTNNSPENNARQVNGLISAINFPPGLDVIREEQETGNDKQ